MRSSAGRSKAGSRARPARPARETPVAELLAGLDRGSFPSTLYLEGPSEALKAALTAEIRRAWAASCPESPRARVMRAAEHGVEEILAAYQGASLFSPRDLTIVLDVEDLGRSERKVLALAGGLALPGGASCLVIVESASDRPRKTLDPLRAACATRVVAAPPARRELQRFGERRLAREGIRTEPGVLEALLDASEGDAVAFFGELDKLCLFAGPDGSLTRRESAALFRPVVGADLPDFLGAVAAGHAGLATQRLGRLLAAGVGEGQVLFALSNLVGGALGGWARWRGLSDTLRRRRPGAELAGALDALYRTEAAWKGGRADVVALLEQATRSVCGAG